jgi:hypothetical protein
MKAKYHENINGANNNGNGNNHVKENGHEISYENIISIDRNNENNNENMK